VQVPAVLIFIYVDALDMKDSRGLYLGVACGYGVLSILYSRLLWNTDWDEVLASAKERSAKKEATKDEVADNDKENTPVEIELEKKEKVGEPSL